MQIFIDSEFGNLKTVAMSEGCNVPEFSDYKNLEQEFVKYHDLANGWKKIELMKEHREFINLMGKYDVEVILLKEHDFPWSLFARDIGFVYKNTFFYSKDRKFKDRQKEFSLIIDKLQSEGCNTFEIVDSPIEGGDVLIDGETLYIGASGRTSKKAALILEKFADIKMFDLGENIMHIDTRLTLLPNKIILCHLPSFTKDDQSFLLNKYDAIELTDYEAKHLASNVFVINPQVIAANLTETRIINELQSRGFNVEAVNYSHVIRAGGAFRCTTMPLMRSSALEI